MKSIVKVCIFLAATGVVSAAFADADGTNVINGRTCKEHLSNAVLSNTWTTLLSTHAEMASPRTTPISEIAAIEVGLDTPVGVRNAVEMMTNVINGCERACSGVPLRNGEFVDCSIIGRGNSNQFHDFSQTDTHMLDDAATNLTQAQLDTLFGTTTTATVADPVVPNVVVDEPDATVSHPVEQPTRNPHAPVVEQMIVL